jgi:hypothetical protein
MKDNFGTRTCRSFAGQGSHAHVQVRQGLVGVSEFSARPYSTGFFTRLDFGLIRYYIVIYSIILRVMQLTLEIRNADAPCSFSRPCGSLKNVVAWARNQVREDLRIYLSRKYMSGQYPVTGKREHTGGTYKW